MDFTKWQGCGNDFVLVDCLREDIKDYAAFARKVCDRHYGVGADGILVVLPSEKADFCMRIFNTDGSEAEMCGNGIRCFARYLYDNGIAKGTEFTVETGAGILVPKIVAGDGPAKAVCVDMGKPVLAGDEIPVTGFGKGQVVSEPIEVAGKTYAMTCVSMGNPHCVVFVEDIASCGIESIGALFESHERFPRKTNTEFVEVRDRKHMRMRVWERGASITLACGTGACATLVAAVLNDKADRKAEIELDGGRLVIEWADNGHIYMTGPAEQVFSGEIEE
ncbi:MAG: diaminopimelate epimerase [Selenomonadaceae bacterium]|nr:diaminopimelate epimerase [Selenomonadaceae bacterium]